MTQTQTVSAVTLRIMGDELVPREISALMKREPTRAHAKGDLDAHVAGPKLGDLRVAQSGMWLLEVRDREPANIDDQIQELLGLLPEDRELWQTLTRRFRVDLFCGFWINREEGGLSLSPRSLAALGERGIEFGLCVYGLTDEISPEEG